MIEKLKSLLLSDRVFMMLLVVLVGVSGFALGRHSTIAGEPVSPSGVSLVAAAPAAAVPTALPAAPPPSAAETAALRIKEDSVQPPTAAAGDGPFVASRNGSKYHHITCSGAARIKEENKVFFPSETAAQAAGYTRAANCAYFTQP